jgi:hypothetical protein
LGYRVCARQQGLALSVFILAAGLSLGAPAEDSADEGLLRERFIGEIDALYRELHLYGQLDIDVFRHALVGFHNLRSLREITGDSPLTIIDYGKPSTEERFFVIDLRTPRLLFKTLVAHGVNSGVDPPHDFSNQVNSLKSSLGFFATLSTYLGRHGYSLKLRGLDPGFNDNAEERHIVIHGADYVSRQFLRRHGRLGHSWGCPALPTDLTRRIIDTIRDGGCLFIYANQEEYLTGSRYLDVASAAREFARYAQDNRGIGPEADLEDSLDSMPSPTSAADAGGGR